MVNLSKGLLVAAAVAGALSLTACASQGTSACGEPAAAPCAAPAPVAACKGMSSCKGKSAPAASSSSSN